MRLSIYFAGFRRGHESYGAHLGDCTLTDEHAASSYGQPVIVDTVGQVYGPDDLLGYIHLRSDRRTYTAAELRWLDDLIVASTLAPVDPVGPRTTWSWGASTKTDDQLRRVEAALGRPLIRNS